MTYPAFVSMDRGVTIMPPDHVKKIEIFNSCFVKTERGDSFVRFDFGGFYEWFRYKNKSTFVVLGEHESQKLEAAFVAYENKDRNKIIYLNSADKKKDCPT